MVVLLEAGSKAALFEVLQRVVLVEDVPEVGQTVVALQVEAVQEVVLVEPVQKVVPQKQRDQSYED
jgi:phage-related baseplate assembly protein